MEFIKSPDQQLGIQALLDRLASELSLGKKVLWLVSGGSAVSAETSLVQSLNQAGLGEGLAIMLMDERYGPAGHSDSNWEQLLRAGCDFTNIEAHPVLEETMLPLDETAARYAKKIEAILGAADVVIGLFGLGPDGHTAGILPDSPAVADSSALVVSYHTEQFDRITLTRAALAQVDAGFVFAFGDAKAVALGRLQENTELFSALPAKLLWDLPEVQVFNDQIGDS